MYCSAYAKMITYSKSNNKHCSLAIYGLIASTLIITAI